MSTAPTPPTVRRAPRFVPPLPNETVVIPDPPAAPSEPSTVLLDLIAPIGITMAIMVLIGILLNYTSLLLFSLPLMVGSVIGMIWTHRRQQQRSKQRRTEREEKYMALLEGEYATYLNELYRREYSLLQENNPALDQCLRVVRDCAPALWARTGEEEDYLCPRIGLGDLPTSFTIKTPSIHDAVNPDPLVLRAQEIAGQFRMLQAVPICFDLRRYPVAGISGERNLTLRSLFSLVMHLTTHHAPNEVKLAAFYPYQEESEWAWMRWLPHTWDDQHRQRYLADSVTDAQELLLRLELIMDERRRIMEHNSRSKDSFFSPDYIVVVADLDMLEKSATLQRLQNEGPDLGFHVLYLSGRTRLLPHACRAALRLRRGRSFVRMKDGESIQELELTVDTVEPDQLERFKTAIAPLRLEQNARRLIPEQVSLFEMYGVRTAADLLIAQRWQQNRNVNERLSVPLGVALGEELLYLDLHERRDGPNGLVAGMVGTGKSELLQTLVLSLAINYPPDRLAFVLVDYKGGGMANPFATLPHNCGIISNLAEPHLARRALESLRTEIDTRQAIFQELSDRLGTHINHIDQYQKLYYQSLEARATDARDYSLNPLPYLVIIVDEFAEMKEEQQEIAREFVRIARTGRALGVRLILAMQKPAGIVDGQIEANTRFRLCLRVAQTEDSAAMLKRPDAAFLKGLGRAFLQVGANEVFREFQVAWSGALCPGDEQNDRKWIRRIQLNGSRSQKLPTVVPRKDEKTQLQAVMAEIEAVYQADTGPTISKLWLPPLKTMLVLDDLIDHIWLDQGQVDQEPEAEWRLSPVVGLMDEPEKKEQPLLRFDLTSGHFAIYGAPLYGKTTLVQTLVTSLARSYTPDDVHVYVLDYGGHFLKPVLENFPHVGQVVTPDDVERVDRLFAMLAQEMVRRQVRLGETNLPTFAEYRKEHNDLPALVFIIDNYSAFQKAIEDNFERTNFLLRLTGEGSGLGIHLVLTMRSPTDLRFNMTNNIVNALTLRLVEEGDYPIIAGRLDNLVLEPVPGRALLRGEPPRVCQIALPAAGNTVKERGEALRTLAAHIDTVRDKPGAPSIAVLTDEVYFDELQLPNDAIATHGVTVPIGRSVATLAPFFVDLDNGPHHLVIGPNGSGKSNLLKTWTYALAMHPNAEQLTVFVFDTERCSLGDVRNLSCVYDYSVHAGEALSTLQRVDKWLDERLRQQRPGGRLSAAQNRVVLIIDDLFDEQSGSLSSDSLALFAEVLKKGRRSNLHIIAAGSTSHKPGIYRDPSFNELRERKAGFVFGKDDKMWLDLQIHSTGQQNIKLRPGQAFYVQGGEQTLVQIALLREQPPSSMPASSKRRESS